MKWNNGNFVMCDWYIIISGFETYETVRTLKVIGQGCKKKFGTRCLKFYVSIRVSLENNGVLGV